MTEQDAKIGRAKCDVKKAQIVLQEKKDKMDRGVIEAQAIFDSRVAGLKSDWLQAQVELDKELIYLQEAEEVIGGSN